MKIMRRRCAPFQMTSARLLANAGSAALHPGAGGRMRSSDGSRTCQVVVVDDDPVNLALAEEVIRFMGAEPITFLDGETALREIRVRDVDMIFMDVHMPGLNGLELTKKRREEEAARHLPRLPIIALTASAMPHELAACLDNGMDDVMTKPFGFDAMRSKLERWCPAQRCEPSMAMCRLI
jgi:two-component system, sensor histidine kinase